MGPTLITLLSPDFVFLVGLHTPNLLKSINFTIYFSTSYNQNVFNIHKNASWMMCWYMAAPTRLANQVDVPVCGEFVKS